MIIDRHLKSQVIKHHGKSRTKPPTLGIISTLAHSNDRTRNKFQLSKRETGAMSEDERYRTSTQYRLWSYSPESLFALRSSTNQIAADRVRGAVRRVREARNDTGEAENGRSASAVVPEGEVDCLTVEEELKLVAYYCRQTILLGDHLKVPTDVKVCTYCIHNYRKKRIQG